MTQVNTNFFSTAIDGLNYAQAALAVVSNNISNAADPSYTREIATRVDPTGGGAGGAIIGLRQTSIYLNGNVLAAQSNSSEQSTYSQQADQLNQLLASANVSGTTTTIPSDVGGAIQNFFTSVNQLSNNPSDPAARQTLLSNANILTSQFASVGTQINNLATTIEQNIQGDISSVNDIAKQLANINQEIRISAGGNNNQPANSLLDQRDQLLQKLSKLVGITTLPQSDGTDSVFMGLGQVLVLGNTAQSLQAVPSTTDTSKTVLSYSSPNGPVVIPDNEIVGGELGALLKFRAQTLVPTSQSLGQLSTSFAMAINNQQALGLDLNGKQGAPIFALPLIPSMGATTNTGDATLAVTMTNPTLTRASDYSVKYDGNNYTITRLSDGSAGVDATGTALPSTTTYSSLPQTVDGLNFTISTGSMKAGDSISVFPYDQTMGGVKVIMTDPNGIAAASGPVAVSSGVNNTGSGVLSITGSTGTVSNNLPSGSAIVTFSSPNTYTITQGGIIGTSETLGANHQLTVNGITLTLSGVPGSNDSFTLAPNTFGIGDNGNIAAMHTLQTANTLNGSSTNFSTYYSSIVSTVGLTGAQYKSTSQAATNVLTSATAAQQTVSGVNTDEEAASLLNFQRQYQAAAKVIQVSNTLFQSLLQI